MTNRTGWPAIGAVGSIRTRMLTPFLSACQEVAGGRFGGVGVIGMVWIVGRVGRTVGAVTAFVVVAVVGRRVVVVARTVEGGEVVVGPTVVLVVVLSGTPGWVISGPPAEPPDAWEVEASGSTIAAERAPAENSRATLTTRI